MAILAKAQPTLAAALAPVLPAGQSGFGFALPQPATVSVSTYLIRQDASHRARGTPAVLAVLQVVRCSSGRPGISAGLNWSEWPGCLPADPVEAFAQKFNVLNF